MISLWFTARGPGPARFRLAPANRRHYAMLREFRNGSSLARILLRFAGSGIDDGLVLTRGRCDGRVALRVVDA
jgi:hypothetical protein